MVSSLDGWRTAFPSLFLGLQNLEEDLHLHLYLESHLLFPRAIDLEAAAVTH